MTNILKKTASVLAVSLVLAGAGGSVAFAKTSASVTDSISDTGNGGGDDQKQSDLQKALKSGDHDAIVRVAQQMIDDRISVLNDLKSDISSFKHVSASDKANLTSNVQSNLDAMTTLRTKIGNDTASSTLRDDAVSITKNYRIGILVHPQVKRTLAADRIETLYGLFQNLATILQSRINAASGISDTDAKSRAQAALDDMKSQIEGANNKAMKAEDEVAGLKPDQGDKTVLDSNNSALADAKSVLGNAVDSIVAARKDVDTIVDILKGKR